LQQIGVVKPGNGIEVIAIEDNQMLVSDIDDAARAETLQRVVEVDIAHGQRRGKIHLGERHLGARGIVEQARCIQTHAQLGKEMR
jgi:hypothetical protein